MLGWASIVFSALALVSLWANDVRPAHFDARFGFQTLACWPAVAGLLAAAALEVRRAPLALGIAGVALISWFAWSMWIVTTPAFTSLPFTWVGTDVIGPGWYMCAIGFLCSAADVVMRFQSARLDIGWEQWLLTAIPGFGLMRLGNWTTGVLYAVVFAGLFFLASVDSPDAGVLHEYGKNNAVPPAYQRAEEWILLVLALGVWVLSIVWTLRERRREGI